MIGQGNRLIIQQIDNKSKIYCVYYRANNEKKAIFLLNTKKNTNFAANLSSTQDKLISSTCSMTIVGHLSHNTLNV